MKSHAVIVAIFMKHNNIKVAVRLKFKYFLMLADYLCHFEQNPKVNKVNTGSYVQIPLMFSKLNTEGPFWFYPWCDTNAVSYHQISFQKGHGLILLATFMCSCGNSFISLDRQCMKWLAICVTSQLLLKLCMLQIR